MSHRHELEEHGVVVLRGVLPGRSVRRLRRAFDRELGPDHPGVSQRPTRARAAPVLREWVLGELLGGLGQELLDVPQVALLQDVLIRKEPGGDGRIGWHRDAWYTGYLDPVGVVSVRLALDEETVHTGALQVLPGSHRWPEVFREGGDVSAIPAAARDLLPPELASVAPHTIELAPGDVSVHLGRTWHGSGTNRSTAPRRTVVTHLFDPRLRVRPDRLPPDTTFPVDLHGRLEARVFPRL